MTATYNIVEADITSCDEFDDGDPPSAACINPLGEGAAALALYARNRVGLARLVDLDTSQVDSTSLTDKGSTTSAVYGTGDVDCGSTVVQAQDTIEVSVAAHFSRQSDAVAYARLAYSIDGGAKTEIAGSEIYMNAGLTGTASPHVLQGVIALGAVSGTLTVWIQMNIAGGNTMHCYSPLSPIIKNWRVNT